MVDSIFNILDKIGILLWIFIPLYELHIIKRDGGYK